MFITKELKGFNIIGISVRTTNANGKSLNAGLDHDQSKSIRLPFNSHSRGLGLFIQSSGSASD